MKRTAVKRTRDTGGRRLGVGWLLVASLLLLAPARARAKSDGASPGLEPSPSPTPAAVATTQDTTAQAEPKPRMEIYGAAMLDMGYQFHQNDPDWFDVLRPTKLPAYGNEYGADGRFFAGVRQSRLGVKGFMPTDLGEIKTIFEFGLNPWLGRKAAEARPRRSGESLGRG